MAYICMNVTEFNKYIILTEDLHITTYTESEVLEILSDVINLDLVGDRVIFRPPSPIYSMLIKSRILNCCDIIETVYNSNIYVIELSPMQHIIYISSGIKAIGFNTLNLSKFKGYLKVIGGSGLRSGDGLFAACELDNLDLSEFSTTSMTIMDRMFSECNVPILDLRAFDTSKVTSMVGMFAECKSKEIIINTWKTSSLIDTSFMFYKCQNLISLDISSLDVSKVEKIPSMFSYTKVPELDLSMLKFKVLLHMEGLFEDAEIPKINLKNLNTSTVNYMRNMFFLTSKQIY